jgi:disulfide oxidoreductase YuzD
MPMVARMCNSVLLMKNSYKTFEGNSAEAIEKYYDNFPVILNQEAISNENIKLRDIDFISIESKYKFKIHLESKIIFNDLIFNLVLMNRELLPVAQINSRFQDVYINLTEGVNVISVNLDSLELNPETYILSISIHEREEKSVLLWNHGIKKIEVTGQKFYGSAPYIIKAKWD